LEIIVLREISKAQNPNTACFWPYLESALKTMKMILIMIHECKSKSVMGYQ
jgi:hypothetical protein